MEKLDLGNHDATRSDAEARLGNSELRVTSSSDRKLWP